MNTENDEDSAIGKIVYDNNPKNRKRKIGDRLGVLVSDSDGSMRSNSAFSGKYIFYFTKSKCFILKRIFF